MIQNPQTWCQTEAFVIRKELVFTENLWFTLSYSYKGFLVKYSTTVSRPYIMLKYVQKEGLHSTFYCLIRLYSIGAGQWIPAC